MAKTKKAKVAVPVSIQEATDFLREIGQTERRIADIDNKLNNRIEALKAAATSMVEPLSNRTMELVEGLYGFAEANRKQLTEDGKTKTVTLPTGTIAWRDTPPAVHLEGVESVIAEIKKLGLDRFLRKPPEEVDKEAMLKDQETAGAIKGVSIDNDEIFVITPSESQAEIKKKLKKKKEPKKNKKE